jgi:hypothetical protein
MKYFFFLVDKYIRAELIALKKEKWSFLLFLNQNLRIESFIEEDEKEEER